MTTVQVKISRIYRGYRARHGVEGGLVNPIGQPAIRPALNAIPIEFTEPMQWAAYNLNEGLLTPDKFRMLYSSRVAFTNEQSWFQIVCRDYINEIDVDAVDEQDKPVYPKLMKNILMGGGFYRGYVDGSYLIIEPGIGAIDANKSIPDIATIKRNHWYFHAVTSGNNIFNFGHCGKFPDGSNRPVLVPYFLSKPAKYPIEWFQKWERNYFPDPLKFYV